MASVHPLFKTTSKLILATLLSLWSWSSQAEQSQDFGDYVVHFNALPTSFISNEVAKQYGITRSKTRVLLNISVLKKVLGTSSAPVTAIVKARATNLTGQLKDIPTRKVSEGQAIYYLGELRVADEETLNFEIEVTPKGMEAPYTVKFRQQFFTD
ncbi:MAG: DUF4426 domain-containing protein [Gammaproteobacteria bacterium]